MIAFALLALLLAADQDAPPANPSPPPSPTKRSGAASSRKQKPPQPAPAPRQPVAPPPPLVQAPPSVARKAVVAAEEPRRLRLGARAGAFVPRTELGAGPFAAIEAAYLLPPNLLPMEALRDRVRVSLSLGFASASNRAPKIVSGRGFDAGFVQNTKIWPIELSASFDVLPPQRGSVGWAVGMGFGLYPTSTEFIAFNAPSTERAAGAGGFLATRASLPLAPGQLFLDVRYSEARARLGPLGDVGTSDLSGFSLTAGYVIDLPLL